MLFTVRFNDRHGVYASVSVEAGDPESAYEQGRTWALEHITKRPLKMTLVMPAELERHDERCACDTCSYERAIAKIHREFNRGLLTTTEYAERLIELSQAFMVTLAETAVGSYGR